MNRKTLTKALEDAARTVEGGIFYVAGPEEAVESVLSIEGVSGAILAERSKIFASPFPDRIGWNGGTAGEMRMPEARAGAAVAFSAAPELSLLFLRRLRAHGVKRIGFISLDTGALKLRPIEVVMLLRISAVLTSRLIDGRIRALVSPMLTEAQKALVTDTQNADETAWSRGLSRIDWSGSPIFAKAADFEPGKIMIVTGSLAAGGSERQVVYTALGLQKRGLAPTVVVTQLGNASDFFRPALDAAKVRVIGLPNVDPLAMDMNVFRLKREIDTIVAGFDVFTDEIGRYVNLFASERPSVVHLWLDWPNCAAGLAALATGVPKIVAGGRSLSPTHFGFLTHFMRPAYLELAKSERVQFLNNSRAGAKDYAAWLGIPPSRIKVIPNSVDKSEHRLPENERVVEFRRAHELYERTPVLGGVFRMMPEKRPMLWLDVAAVVSERLPSARFVLVGGGPELTAVKNRAGELGLTNKLVITGEISDVTVPLAVMSCLLLTSRVEGLPNVLLEAQLSGVPVVTSAVGGAPETIDDGGTAGSAIEGNNPADYAEAILAWLQDPDRCRVARDILPVSVLERFSHTRMLNLTLDAYSFGAQPRAMT